jgi:hypothetical protein
VEFFVNSKYILTCALSKKCLVVSYSKDLTHSRIVNIGFDSIGNIFMMNMKFFGVTHPQKKIISFFELEEKECASKIIKKCNPFITEEATECSAGYWLQGTGCHCTKGKYKKN